MFSASRNLAAQIAALVLVMLIAASARAQLCCDAPTTPLQAWQSTGVLRVASDPNNLPFSNDRLEGFENKVAQLIADELHLKLEYVWRAQRRGFFREGLKEGRCDMVMGAPSHFDMALTTVPYYRSSYTFVTRGGQAGDLSSFDDPRLKQLKVGVQLVGDDGVNTPPAHALAVRGITGNIVGFTVYGNYTDPNPPARIVEAVAKGTVDVAIVWGPLAGYFAAQQSPPLAVTPGSSQKDGPLPMAFDICIGVRKKDALLRDQVNEVLFRKHEQIDKILDAYHVPRVERPARPAASARAESEEK